MKKALLVLTILSLTIPAMAQPPLSKRDQQRKAEFEALIEAEKNYEATIDEADEAFRNKDYVKARMKYQEAIQYNPKEEQWLTSKVNDLDILMAKIIAREVDSVLVLNQPAPRKVDVEIASPEVQEAMEAEQPVVNIPPPPPPPKEEEELVIPEQPKITPKETPPPTPTPMPEVTVEKRPQPTKPRPVKPAPKKEEKVLIDFSKYPQGMTDETFEFPDHTVRRIIVKDGMDTIVYKYVTHRWGGKFYFKDGVSIVERIWKQEVEAFKEKYPEE